VGGIGGRSGDEASVRDVVRAGSEKEVELQPPGWLGPGRHQASRGGDLSATQGSHITSAAIARQQACLRPTAPPDARVGTLGAASFFPGAREFPLHSPAICRKSGPRNGIPKETGLLATMIGRHPGEPFPFHFHSMGSCGPFCGFPGFPHRRGIVREAREILESPTGGRVFRVLMWLRRPALDFGRAQPFPLNSF
jgi:hypothetical protein